MKMRAGAVATIDQYFKQRTGTSVKIDQEAHICFSFSFEACRMLLCAQELHLVGLF